MSMPAPGAPTPALLETFANPNPERDYTIRIRNAGNVPARLLGRHWVITDANGKVEQVDGEGDDHRRPSRRRRASTTWALAAPHTMPRSWRPGSTSAHVAGARP